MESNTLSFQALNLVRRSRGAEVVLVQLIAESTWGHSTLQIIFYNGEKLTRLSEEDGHYAYCDAYDLPESADRILD